MAAALTDLKVHEDHARSDGWCDGIEHLSVWKTSRANPPGETYCHWVERHGVKVAEAVESFRDERPDPPADLEGEALEDWRADNWPVAWDHECIVEYELREIQGHHSDD